MAGMQDERDLLNQTAQLAADWVESVSRRRIPATASVAEMRVALGGPMPSGPSDPATVIAELARNAEPGLTSMGSGRYFGFVIGGTLPAALAADWLVSAWDQNAVSRSLHRRRRRSRRSRGPG